MRQERAGLLQSRINLFDETRHKQRLIVLNAVNADRCQSPKNLSEQIRHACETKLDNRRKELPTSIAKVVATGAGIGFIPFAPGTFGSLLGLPIVFFLNDAPPLLVAVSILMLFLVGIPACTLAARKMQAKDPGSIVFDEIAAMPIAFFPVLCLGLPLSVWTAVAGFLWFRLFDIVKPWPAHALEKLPEGLGIMIDDTVAGIYAGAALWLTIDVLGIT